MGGGHWAGRGALLPILMLTACTATPDGSIPRVKLKLDPQRRPRLDQASYPPEAVISVPRGTALITDGSVEDLRIDDAGLSLWQPAVPSLGLPGALVLALLLAVGGRAGRPGLPTPAPPPPASRPP